MAQMPSGPKSHLKSQSVFARCFLSALTLRPSGIPQNHGILVSDPTTVVALTAGGAHQASRLGHQGPGWLPTLEALQALHCCNRRPGARIKHLLVHGLHVHVFRRKLVTQLL